MSGVLFLVVCGSPRAADAGRLVELLQDAGWRVYAVATRYGLDFMDVPEIERLTGQPVRHKFRAPTEAKTVPTPDAVVVCPATFNTVNKLACGISDTLALGVVAEAIGAGTPVVVAPAVSTALAGHRAFARSVAELRAAGVTVLYGPGEYEPVPPGQQEPPYPYDLILAALTTTRSRSGEGSIDGRR